MFDISVVNKHCWDHIILRGHEYWGVLIRLKYEIKNHIALLHWVKYEP